jgi:hypothetical protein
VDRRRNGKKIKNGKKAKGRERKITRVPTIGRIGGADVWLPSFLTLELMVGAQLHSPGSSTVFSVVYSVFCIVL